MSSQIQECKRFNENKPKWSLIDFKSLEPLVRVMEMGMSKYGYNNWKAGRSFTETLESLLRHIIAWKETKSTDDESGITHLAHAAANVMFLLQMEQNSPEFDDREIATFPNTATSSNTDFNKWKVSFVINCKLYNPELYSNITEDQMLKFYTDGFTPMQCIRSK